MPHAAPVIASLFLHTSCVAFTWGRSAGARHAMREAGEAAMFLLSVAVVLTGARKNESAPYSPFPFLISLRDSEECPGQNAYRFMTC